MANERNPGNTRTKILHAAFQQMHQHGFQGLRIDQILSSTGLKKGALYHHFQSKQALGYAVLEELIEPRIYSFWIAPLQNCNDPLQDIQSMCEHIKDIWSDDFFTRGCPLNNLAQEMSPIDEGFRHRIERFFQLWIKTVSLALQNGQLRGMVANDISPDECAIFIVASIEGALGMAKNQRDKNVYITCIHQLQRYLNSLKK